MSLFDQLADQALETRGDLFALRSVVEKELLHHDILREMADAGLLAGLTFIGGTCLRMCYGSNRLSEDLDFTGGSNFNRSDLMELGAVLTRTLKTRYGLPVNVSDPVKSVGKVATWKLTIETRIDRKHLPAQRIHIDICAIPSRDPRPMMLRNHYGIDLGTSGLILQAQSRGEILADKIIALAFREGRIKNRDLWDVIWLVQQNVELPEPMIALKIRDHQRTQTEFVKLLQCRLSSLKADPGMRTAYLAEMRRFLPAAVVRQSLEHSGYWDFLCATLDDLASRAIRAL